MTRRIILILVGAFVVLALMFALWFWLFGKQTTVEEQLGGFGAADNRGAGVGTGAGTGGNTQTLIGGTTDTNGAGGTSNIQTPLYVSPPYTPPDISSGSGYSGGGSYTPPDVDWLDGSTSGGEGVGFNPTPINAVNNIDIEGTAYFTGSVSAGSPGGVGLGGALLGVAGGCVAQYLTQKAVVGGANVVQGAAQTAVTLTDLELQHLGYYAVVIVLRLAKLSCCLLRM